MIDMAGIRKGIGKGAGIGIGKKVETGREIKADKDAEKKKVPKDTEIGTGRKKGIEIGTGNDGKMVRIEIGIVSEGEGITKGRKVKETLTGIMIAILKIRIVIVKEIETENVDAREARGHAIVITKGVKKEITKENANQRATAERLTRKPEVVLAEICFLKARANE